MCAVHYVLCHVGLLQRFSLLYLTKAAQFIAWLLAPTPRLKMRFRASWCRCSRLTTSYAYGNMQQEMDKVVLGLKPMQQPCHANAVYLQGGATRRSRLDQTVSRDSKAAHS